MENNIFVYIVFILVLSNCSCNPGVKKTEGDLKLDTLISSKDLNLLVKYKNENEYQFIVESEGRKFETQIMKGFPSGLPKVERIENHWIYLRGGCGSSCFYAYILPTTVNGKDSIKTYMFPLYVESKKNIIVYCSDDHLMIENYVNGKSITFKDERLLGPYCGFFIEKVIISGSNIEFQINSSNTLTEEKIDIRRLL